MYACVCGICTLCMCACWLCRKLLQIAKPKPKSESEGDTTEVLTRILTLTLTVTIFVNNPRSDPRAFAQRTGLQSVLWTSRRQVDFGLKPKLA